MSLTHRVVKPRAPQFFPTIGTFVLARHLGTLPPSLAHKFSWRDRTAERVPGDKAADHRPDDAVRRVMTKEGLAAVEDLKAPAVHARL
jgi:hypothetical protein